MLIDSDAPSKNLNIDFMFSDTAAVVKELRDSGHVVFLHCVQAQSRTPSVAITYSVEQLGKPFETAATDIKAALPESKINSLFLRHLERLR
jgi:protein-tyrosine phosphatase